MANFPRAIVWFRSQVSDERGKGGIFGGEASRSTPPTATFEIDVREIGEVTFDDDRAHPAGRLQAASEPGRFFRLASAAVASERLHLRGGRSRMAHGLLRHLP